MTRAVRDSSPPPPSSRPAAATAQQSHIAEVVSEVEEAVDRLAALSPRQLEVLAHISAGATNRQISRRLQISVATVEDHVRDLKYRLRVEARCTLAVVGYIGFISPRAVIAEC